MRRIDAGADAAIDLAPNPVSAADRCSAVHSFSCSAAINRDARDADYIAASHPHPADVRLISVSLLSLPFRAAHAVGDVAQNTLLGLATGPDVARAASVRCVRSAVGWPRSWSAPRSAWF